MKRTPLLIAIAIILLSLALPAGVLAQEQGYRTKAGDTLASIARQYCTTWQDIFYNNQGILGNDPSVLTPGVLIYVVNRLTRLGPDTHVGQVHEDGRMRLHQALAVDDYVGRVEEYRSRAHSAGALLLLVLPALEQDAPSDQPDEGMEEAQA